MATLTNNINAQNIVDRFSDYVVATANSGIVYGTNNWPFTDTYNLAPFFGGTTAGRGIGIVGTDWSNTTIFANALFNRLIAETYAYTNIRSTHWVLYVDGGGGNRGSRPTPGAVVNVTGKSHLNTSYRTGVNYNGTTKNGVISPELIKTSELESLFDRLRAIYTGIANSTIEIPYFHVCHASCHGNCHGSRTRR
jgi:hypothetical protein